MVVKYNINASSSGLRVVILPISDPVIEDSNGNIIPYKILANIKGIGYSMVIVKFPGSGTYKAYSGTPQEDSSLVSIIDADTIAGGTASTGAKASSIDGLIPAFEKLFSRDIFTSNSGSHIQGVAIEGDGIVWAVTSDTIVRFDIKHGKVLEKHSISEIADKGQSHMGDPDYCCGKLYLLIMNWNGSTQSNTELLIIDPNGFKVEKRIPIDDSKISVASGVHTDDGTKFYLSSYTTSNIYVIDDNGNLLETHDLGTNVNHSQGLTRIGNGMLAIANGNYLTIVDEKNNWTVVGSYLTGNCNVLEGIDYKDGAAVYVAAVGSTNGNFMFMFLTDGKVVTLDSGETNGSNKFVKITDIANVKGKTLIFTQYNDFNFSSSSGCSNTNKAPGIALYNSESDALVFEQSGGAFNAMQFTSNGNNAVSSVNLETNSFPDYNTGDAGIIMPAIQVSLGDKAIGTIYDRNNYGSTDPEDYSSYSNIGYRVWRYKTFFSPLYIVDGTYSIPNITIEEEQENSPTTNTSTSSTFSSKIILAILGLLGLLFLLGRKKR